MNKETFLSDIFGGRLRKPLPILSYPGAAFVCRDIGELVRSSRLQASVMKAAADRCASAASVCLMDLSVEAECFGAKAVFSSDSVPVISDTLINSNGDAAALKVPSVGSARSGIFIDTVKRAKELISDRPVICGAAAPFSLAGRLLGVTEIMFLCFDEPKAVHEVLKKSTGFLIGYINAMKAAGADGVILAEPVAGLLSPDLEEEFSAPYTKQLAEAVGGDDFLTVYHNCGQSVIRMTDSVFSNGCDAYHFGNSIDLAAMLEKAPADKLVMGNIDPVAYFKDGTPEMMREAVNDLLGSCGKYDNFLLSSGCDIPMNAKWENIDAFFKASEEYYGR